MDTFFRKNAIARQGRILTGLVAAAVVVASVTLGSPAGFGGLVSGPLKESAKATIVRRAHAIDDPDCITVAGMMEEEPALALEDGNLLRFLFAIVGADEPHCASVIEGYLPQPVAANPEAEIEEAGHVAAPAVVAGPNRKPDVAAAVARPAIVSRPDITVEIPIVKVPPRAGAGNPGPETREAADARDEPLTPMAFQLSYEELPDEIARSAQAVRTYRAAHAFIAGQLRFKYLVPQIITNPTTQARYLSYGLPRPIATNTFILDVLGQTLPTRAGERLPAGVVAIVPHFPEGTVAKLGPHVWANHPGVSNQIYGRSMEAMYGALGYPTRLFAEIFVQYQQEDRFSPFRTTDRIGPFLGSELRRGRIEHGSVYLCTENGAWRLYEYPNIPATGDCAVLMWNWNPRVNGRRQFDPDPDGLIYQQNAQLNVTIRARSAGRAPQNNVGPSIMFRTDAETGESDFIIFAPYVYLANPAILDNLAFGAPLPSGRLPDPNTLILASPDLHYAFTNGAGTGAGLDGPDGARNPKVIRAEAGGRPLEALGRYANSASLYIGLYGFPDAATTPRPPALPE